MPLLAPPRRTTTGLTHSAVAAAFGVATGWLIGAGKRRKPVERRVNEIPDDPAWHAALNSSHPPRA
jgi:hypothetical protein